VDWPHLLAADLDARRVRRPKGPSVLRLGAKGHGRMQTGMWLSPTPRWTSFACSPGGKRMSAARSTPTWLQHADRAAAAQLPQTLGRRLPPRPIARLAAARFSPFLREYELPSGTLRPHQASSERGTAPAGKTTGNLRLQGPANIATCPRRGLWRAGELAGREAAT